MTYLSDIDGLALRAPTGRGTRQRPRLPFRGVHAKFARLETLEHRLLFSGDLDPSFGVGGRSRIDIANLADTATALHVLANGRILVAGIATYGLGTDLQPVERAYVARLNANGSLDATFGTAGIATYDAVGADAPVVTRAQALAVGADGRIFVGGTTAMPSATTDSNAAFAVAAFTATGAADTTFGQGGVAVADMTSQPTADDGEWVTQLLVQTDGRIVAVGGIGNVARGGGMVGVVRFEASGALDVSFARRIETLGLAQGLPGTAAVLQDDGKIVLADRRGSTDGSFIIFRYNADGTYDLSFSDDGYALAPIHRGISEFWVPPGPVGICDVLVQPDGKVVAAGRASGSEVAVFRFNADGAPDTTFGDAGSFITATGPLTDVDLEFVPADGGITLASVGNYGLLKIDPPAAPPAGPNGFQSFVGRYSATGAPISSARMDGTLEIGAEHLNVVTLLPDGKLLAAGVSHPTAYAGEGAAWDQTADGLVVRIDPAAAGGNYSTLPPPFTVLPPAPPAPPPVTLPIVVNDPPPPTGFTGKATVTRGRFYAFKLIYADADRARGAQLDISGPAGSVGSPQLLKVRPPGRKVLVALGVDAGNRPVVASYRAAAPGGKFDVADNGPYSVRFMHAQGPTVGQFTVAVPARRPPQAAVHQLAGVLRADVGQPGSWGLQRRSGGALPLDVAAVPADALALSGQRVVVEGTLRNVLNVSAQGGRKSRVFVVTSIRAAAP